MSTPDPMWLAMSKLRRGHVEDCLTICTKVLQATHNLDQAAWLLKCRAVTQQQHALNDPHDMEEEGVAELLLDDNATASLPRPGTSIARPSTAGSLAGGGGEGGLRPVTSSGRPLTGFARPGTGTSSASPSSSGGTDALRRPGTTTSTTLKRAVTALGREIRLGTASLAVGGIEGQFIDVQKLDFRKFVKRPALAMALADYLLYSEHDPGRALELSAEATEQAEFKFWYWKDVIGRCYFRLGLYREAEKQFRSSLKQQEMLGTYLALVQVYLKLDLPNTALDLLLEALRGRYEDDTRLLLGVARIYDMVHDMESAIKYYKRVLVLDSSNVEAIACLAAHYFYTDQPEVGLRFYRRLLQMGMGVSSPELWNNLGLSCFYASQYDMSLSCFERALSLASDDSMADIWANVGQVAIAMGDLGLAYQALKIAISVDNSHAESYCNLGVLEQRKQHLEAARAHFSTAQTLGPHLFEPFFNGALVAYKLGEFQEAFRLALQAQAICPDHADTKDLLKTLGHSLS